jgi:hypothetical protein
MRQKYLNNAETPNNLSNNAYFATFLEKKCRIAIFVILHHLIPNICCSLPPNIWLFR